MTASTGEATTRSRVVWWVLGIVGAIIATVAATLIVNWISDPDGPSPSAAITDPATGAYVGQVAPVAGTSADIDDPDNVMLVVYWPDGRRYYPAVEPLDFEADGDWTGRAAVGGPDDAGVGFDLIVILNDIEAQAELRAYLEQVVADGSAPGLDALPEGSRRLDTVTVTRL